MVPRSENTRRPAALGGIDAARRDTAERLCDAAAVSPRIDGPTLLVAGEPSGDNLARALAPALAPLGPLLVFGPRLRATDVASEHVGRPVDAAMGASSLPMRLARTALDLRRLATLARRRGVRRAVLVNWTEASAWLGRWLRAAGIPVLQVVAPQVFAWRSGRLGTFGQSCDAMAVLFAFEEPLWRRAGVAATFVGHPAAEWLPPPRQLVKRIDGRQIALLPGSRRSEVARLLPTFLAAAARLGRDGVHATVLLAGQLDERTQQAARRHSLAAGIPVRDLPATTPLAASLAAFDAAIAASGTATLECALAGVPPVIAYRVDPLSAALFRRLATTRRVGLPNVLLGRDVFPELLQEAATPEALAAAARGVLANPPNVRDELLEHVRPNDGRTFAARVASLAEAL